MNTTDLSIIIVNWNTQDLLDRCLKAIYSTLSSLSAEVIVVDNASTDGTQDFVRRDYPQVKLIVNKQNLGFARANNQGLRLAQGRYHLLLNTDAFVHQGALKTMVRFMDEQPEAGAAGCRLYYEDGSLQRSCTSFPTLSTELWQAFWLDRLFPASPTFGKYWMTYWEFNDTREVDSIIGAFMMLRPEAISEVGGFDPGFFMYSEEVDLCYRLKQRGWKVMFTPKATATHIWGGTSKRIPEETTFLRLYGSRMHFFRKHYGLAAASLFKVILLVGSLVRVFGGSAVFLMRRNINTLRVTRNYLALLRSLRAL
jgi:GT2 family glycosyltransferase